MLNKKELCPYIRVAMHSTLIAPFVINERSIYDYEIIFVKDGKCKITIEGITYTAEKNQVVFFRPGIKHKLESIDGIDFVQPHIHFDAVYNKNSEQTTVSFKSIDNMTQYELSLIQEDVFEKYDIPYLFVPEDTQKFQKLLFEIIELFSARKYNYELICKAKMLELINVILKQFDGKKADTNTTMQSTAVLVKSYIDNNFQFNISLDFLSEQFYTNKFTLMRNFKAAYGKNIIEYYRTKRIEYAKNMLKTTNLSVHSIGEQLNFTDIYSFSRFFKSYTGMSPVEYKKLKPY